MVVRPEKKISVYLLTAALAVAGCVGKIAGKGNSAGKTGEDGTGAGPGGSASTPPAHAGNGGSDPGSGGAGGGGGGAGGAPGTSADGGASTPQTEGGSTQRDGFSAVDVVPDRTGPDALPERTESGLPPGTTLNQLTPEQKQTFCQWGTTLAGGLGSAVSCPGGRKVQLPWSTLNTCINAIPPACKATVAEVEVCAKAVVADPCVEDVPPPCKTLAGCVLDRFYGDGGAPENRPPPDAAPPPAPPDAAPPPPPPDAAPPPPPLPVCTLGSTLEEIEKNVFVPKCGACHGPVPILSKLDLTSPGVVARVVNAMTDSASTGKCQGKVLLVPGDPLGSLFVEKVASETPACGVRMPMAMPVEQAVIDCVKRWAVMAAEGK